MTLSIETIKINTEKENFLYLLLDYIVMKEKEFTILEFQRMPLEEEGEIKKNGIEVKWIWKDSDLVKNI